MDIGQVNDGQAADGCDNHCSVTHLRSTITSLTCFRYRSQLRIIEYGLSQTSLEFFLMDFSYLSPHY